MPKQRLLYGKDGLEVVLPDDVALDVVEPKYKEGIADQTGAIRNALNNPIGTPPLTELLKKQAKVGVVVNDITRATPYRNILPPLLELLQSKNVEIVFFIATGTHRANTDDELITMLGEHIVGSYRVIQNDCHDRGSHTYIGTTTRQNDVRIHSELLECDIKILTGFFEPHFFAGYSGGGKALMPGMAELSTIEQNHSANHIRDKQARWDITAGNPIWEDVAESAHFVDGVFMLNVVMNVDQEIRWCRISCVNVG